MVLFINWFDRWHDLIGSLLSKGIIDMILRNMPIQYAAIIIVVKNDNFQMNFHIFAQNIDCGYTLQVDPSQLTSTYNLCFRAKIRK